MKLEEEDMECKKKQSEGKYNLKYTIYILMDDNFSLN